MNYSLHDYVRYIHGRIGDHYTYDFLLVVQHTGFKLGLTGERTFSSGIGT